MTDRFEAVITAIDAANDADPTRIAVDGELRSAATVYGERMSAWLAQLAPGAGELLRIAVRAQHLERFKLPRSAFPMDKAGYFRWRNEQKRRHATRLVEFMRDAGFDEMQAGRAAAILRKENLRSDPHAQLLEDCACLVFLEYEFAAFAAPHEPDKVTDILAKTWAKMSPLARSEAVKLPFAAHLAPLVRQAILRQSGG